MNRWSGRWSGVALGLVCVGGILLLGATARERDDRIVLLPRVRNGETVLYESHARIDRHVQTKSNVATMLRPGEMRQDLSTQVRLSVQEARLVDNKLLMAAETKLEPEIGRAHV